MLNVIIYISDSTRNLRNREKFDANAKDDC